MSNKTIYDLTNAYNEPNKLNLDIARKIAESNTVSKEIARDINAKGRSRKNIHAVNIRKKLKSSAIIGALAALGISSTVLFGKNVYSKFVENARITQIASQGNLDEYDFSDETTISKFSILLQETTFLLNSKNLSEQDKIKLKSNLLTIESNLGNVIDFTNTKISQLFNDNDYNYPSVTLKAVHNTVDGPSTMLTIHLDENHTYSFSSNDNITPMLNSLKGENSLKSNKLKSLINNQLDLYSIECNQTSYSLEKTFNLVKENFEQANSLKNLSIHIDKNGNIIEDTKSIEK